MSLRRTSLSLLLFAFLAYAQQAPKRAPDVRYEPSPDRAVAAMLQLAEVNKDDVVYDLGCGDGRFVIAAARDYGARGVGIDIDPARIAESVANARKAGVTRLVTFREADLFGADFREATVVVVALWPSLNLKLRPRLLKELRPGTRVVSIYHDMGGWTPEMTRQVDGNKIFLWRIPEKPASAR